MSVGRRRNRGSWRNWGPRPLHLEGSERSPSVKGKGRKGRGEGGCWGKAVGLRSGQLDRTEVQELNIGSRDGVGR